MRKPLKNELYHNSVRIGKIVLYYPFGTKNSIKLHFRSIADSFMIVLRSILYILLFPLSVLIDISLMLLDFSIPKFYIVQDGKEFDKLKWEYKINSIIDADFEDLKSRINKGEI